MAILLQIILVLFLNLFFVKSTYSSSVLNDLGTPLNYTESVAQAINDPGHIVGYTDPSRSSGNRAFIYIDGLMNLLPLLPGGVNNEAFDINNRKLIVGGGDGLFNGSSQHHAVVWENNEAKDLGTLGGYFSEARGINNKGQIVGFSTDAQTNTSDSLPFIYEHGIMRALPTEGGRNNFAYDINENGQVVGAVETPEGYYAALWENGELINLGVQGHAYAINNKGQIVGSMSNPNVSDARAFVWENGVVKDLGTLAGTRSEAQDINEKGQIIGFSNYSENTLDQSKYHAVLWQNGIITDLGTLGGTNSFATGINSRGSITGFSTLSSNLYHSFLIN